MMRRSTYLGNISVLFLVLGVLVFGAIIYLSFNLKKITPVSVVPSTPADLSGFGDYTSRDLNITFKYPENWFVDEKGFDVMITSYETKFGEGKEPESDQIKIFIGIFPNCFPDYEQDLIYPACGEGGEASKNAIVSKESRQVLAGMFYKYVVRTPRDEDFVYYILYKDDKNIFQIDKRPDPSQFEREFEEIVNSIQFID